MSTFRSALAVFIFGIVYIITNIVLGPGRR